MTDPAIPASTLVVVRDSGAGAPKLLMVERASGMAFAGGAMVFPGGRIDEADRALASDLGLGEHGAAAVTAIRETLEETAIPVALDPLPSPDLARQLQQELVAERPFADLLREGGLSLDPGLLEPFARWVPKFHAARRFDTVFFVAPAPPGDWCPVVIAGECSAAEWLTARDMLDRDSRGEGKIIFPTRRNLERLARLDSYGAILADARAFPLNPITPWLEERDGTRYVTIPEGIGYPVTRERIDGLWRG
ncbi:MAG TPA: NUDIX domain-containing protein [Sphingomicrobium sp.]|nr:NUDIX domain-containing protein [Sphingomicrobium sp.]